VPGLKVDVRAARLKPEIVVLSRRVTRKLCAVAVKGHDALALASVQVHGAVDGDL
jgi:hypothetical protein